MMAGAAIVARCSKVCFVIVRDSEKGKVHGREWRFRGIGGNESLVLDEVPMMSSSPRASESLSCTHEYSLLIAKPAVIL